MDFITRVKRKLSNYTFRPEINVPNNANNAIFDREIRETVSTTTSIKDNNLTSKQTKPVAYYIGCMDIGNFVDKVNLDPYIKYSILRNHWIPPPNYEYPWSEHIRAGGTKKRKPSKKHLDNYTWLVLSDVCKGLFCKYCFLFAPTNVSNVELKTLVKKPLLNFGKLTGKNGYLEVHNRNKYHRDALQSGQHSAKRQVVLKNILKHNLKGLCQTRWIEMHDGVLQFKSSLSKIVESLVEIQSWTDKASSSKALSLVSTICTSEFLISLYSLIDVLKHSLVVSRLLQSDSLDLQNATQATQSILELLGEKRNSCNQEFKHIFSEAQKMATELGFEIKLPRLVKTMNHRANYPTEGEGNEAIENYYRCSIYIPLLDGIYTDLKTRLNPNTLELFDLRLLIPKVFLTIMASDKNSTRQILQQRILKIVPKFNYLWQNDDYTKDVLAGVTRDLKYAQNAPFGIREQLGLTMKSSVKMTASYDTRDSGMFPSYGSLVTAVFSVAQNLLGLVVAMSL
ncbi:hypothetical protein ACI65C_000110 [Semiaphis heraclei]